MNNTNDSTPTAGTSGSLRPPTDDLNTRIEIELVDSVHAKITIAGKQMDYILVGKRTGLHPLTDEERNATIGGMIASRLCDVLSDILQAHIPEEGNAQDDSWGPWEKLSERVADTTYRRMM